jgi:uncharacterized membrane protein YjjP (DUF1212 family)
MILLQAGMMGGLILVIIFGIFLLIYIPILTGIFMKLFWRLIDKKEKIENNISYYKDPFPFLISIAFSIFTLIVPSYLLIIWFDKAVK